jgi:hypothetical protein
MNIRTITVIMIMVDMICAVVMIRDDVDTTSRSEISLSFILSTSLPFLRIFIIKKSYKALLKLSRDNISHIYLDQRKTI